MRVLFLASAVDSGLLPFLIAGRSFGQVSEHLGCSRPERLEAWLSVGVELGELGLVRSRYVLRGRRARALGGGDPLLTAHYRTLFEYQVGPYAELAELLGSGPSGGRDDLDRYADDIAQVSTAASPFLEVMVAEVVRRLHPARVLDAGCGSGLYSKAVLEADPEVRVDGVDLAPSVVEAARRHLHDAGVGSRASLHVGDFSEWATREVPGYNLVMALNNVYYFDPATRPSLYRRLGEALAPGGELLVASMTAPGSLAAAHLHFMLVCQSQVAALPRPGEIAQDLRAVGFEILEQRQLVPTEPLVAVRAAPLWAPQKRGSTAAR